MTHHFLPPSWALTRDGGEVRVLDLATGSGATLDGEIARVIFEDQELAARRLAALGAIQPVLGLLGEAVAEHAPKEWNRATLLEGSGWDMLFLELTARCNERCLHCYAESTPERTETLPDEVVTRVIASAKEAGFTLIQLTGGDPLIAPMCVAAARQAKDLGLRVEVYTNGLALHGEVFDELAALDVSFAFSFYSYDAETHDEITRRPGSHARTLDAIRQSVEAGLKVRVSIVILAHNDEDLLPTIELIESVGVDPDAIRYDRERRVGRGEDGEEVVLPADPRANTHGIGGERPRFGGKVAVRPDGAVVPCIFDRDTVLGNVFDDDLGAIIGRPVAIASPSPLSFIEASALKEKLTCYDCRIRAKVLESMDLVTIRTPT